MTVKPVSLAAALRRGRFDQARTFTQVEPDLFLIDAPRPFYVVATALDLIDIGLRESRRYRTVFG